MLESIINPELIKNIENWNPDALLVIGWSFKSHLKVLRHFHNKKLILFRGDSTLLGTRSGVRSILRKLFLKWVYRHVNFALYVGSQNKKYFEAAGLKEEYLIFAPHAVDNSRFSEITSENSHKAKKWREELKIADEDIVILYAGKLEPVKNLSLLIDAFNELYDTELMNSVHLVIIGDGPDEIPLKKKAVNNNKIHFIGFKNQSEMPAVYQMGSIFVLPSLSETWGLSVNEAMASKIPVLVSDRAGCAADLIVPGITGWTFISGNKSDLQLKINTAVENGAALKKMGMNAAEKISSWSFEKIAATIEETLENNSW